MTGRRTLKKSYAALRKALCLVLAVCMAAGAFACAPFNLSPRVEAAGTPYLYSYNYQIRVKLDVTDDADGWNHAIMKIYSAERNGISGNYEETQQNIKDYVDNGDDHYDFTMNCGTNFPNKVTFYIDFGGGFTWREWGADVTIYINGVNVKSQHIVAKSGCFSSSDTTITLSVDKTLYPYPKTINVLNHHPQINELPDEENFNEFYEGSMSDARGYVFVNACDQYGVTWYGNAYYGGQANSVTNNSGDRHFYCDTLERSDQSFISEGSIYMLYSLSGTDHATTYTFSYNTANTSHSTVTKQVTVYYYFKHTLTVTMRDEVIQTTHGFTGDFVDLASVEAPTGYSINGYNQTGLGELEYISDDDSYQFTFGDSDATLDAIVKANKYKIAFDGNGAESGSIATKTATYDTPYQLPANNFSRTNYKFIGWNTAADGSGETIANRGFAVNLTPVAGETVTLYAQWALMTVDLTLIYPPEMGLPNKVVSVLQNTAYEPDPVLEVGSDEFHYVFDYAEEDLSCIRSAMDVHVHYHAEDHLFNDPEIDIPPTCGVDGQSITTCMECGYYETAVLPALTHDYVGPVWTWATDCSTAQAAFTCLNCGDVQTVNATVSTVDDGNLRSFTATASYDGETYTAQETRHIYSVQFDLNGGFGSKPTQTVLEGVDYVVPSLGSDQYAPYASFLGWRYGETVYQPGDVIEAADMTLVAEWEVTWSNIQRAINGGATFIELSCDITATPGDGPLTIPSGMTLVIDLNGFTLDRALTEPTADGSVIKVASGGMLTLRDSADTGMVTGGNTTGNGGGVCVESGGALTLTNTVHICYNQAAGNGGGVYVNNGSLRISTSVISENICGGNGGGVYAEGSNASTDMNNCPVVTRNASLAAQGIGGVYSAGGSFHISDHTQIFENYLEDGSNANLYSASVVTVWQNLSDDALIGITGAPGVALVEPDTNDAGIHVDPANFRSDDPDYDPALNAQGKLILVDHVHVLGEPTWVWSEDRSTAEAQFVCTVCNRVAETVSATVTQTGSNDTHYIYTATVTFNGTTYTDTATKGKTWNIYVGGVQVSGDNCNDILGDGAVTYNVSANTLTLTDAVIETHSRAGDESNEFGIRYSVNRSAAFKIVLNGENHIVNNATDVLRVYHQYGIAVYNANSNVDCKPVISGSGSLIMEMDSKQFSCIGIHSSGSVTTIDGCTIDIMIDNTAFMIGTGDDEALHCNNTLKLQNGADVTLGTITKREARSLNAKTLNVSADSSLSLHAGDSGCALDPYCTLYFATPAHEVLAYDETEALWDGTTKLSNYKHIDLNPAQIRVTDHSLSLNGDIGVNFYVYIPNADATAGAAFTVADRSVTVPIDITKYIEDSAGRKSYKFSCDVYSGQTDTPITGTISQGSLESEPISYSVHDYLTQAAELAQETQNPELIRLMPLASAIATYGYYANELFGYDVDFHRHPLADDSLFDEITSARVEDMQADIYDAENGLTSVGTSLVLRSTTSAREYFKLKAGQTLDDFTFTAYIGEEETELTPNQNGQFYYIQIPNIPSARLADSFFVSVTNGEEEEVNFWVFSPMSYAYKVLLNEEEGNDTVSPELVNLVKALILYYWAADEYFNH